jgi:hypothetical protein
MTILTPAQRVAFAAVLAGSALTALPVSAHVIPIKELRTGIAMTQAQCASLPSTVWLNLHGRAFCIRYYMSSAGGEGTRPVVFLEGDKLGAFNVRTGEYKIDPEKDKDIDTDNLDRIAEILSKRNKTTAIYFGRVGVDGSSGDHRWRHSLLELHVTNAALDAIKQRHKLEGFHLVGQSGGSTLVGGVLGLRSDIGCAAIGAGRVYNPPSQWPKGPAGLTVEQFNPADRVAAIAQRRDTRIMVITDPEDRRVSEKNQTPFVQMLRFAGGKVDHFIVQATDENRHNMTPYALAATAACVRGDSSQDIAQNLTKLVEKRLADKAKADANKIEPAKPAQPNVQTQLRPVQPPFR